MKLTLAPANICWSSRRLEEVFKTCLQRNNFTSSKTSWGRLEDVLEDEKLLRWRHLQDVLKTCLEDVLKTCLEDVLKTCLEDVLKTYLEDVFKTSWRQKKCLMVISVSNKSMFHKSISEKSKANPKCVTYNPIISIFVLFWNTPAFLF